MRIKHFIERLLYRAPSQWILHAFHVFYRAFMYHDTRKEANLLLEHKKLASPAKEVSDQVTLPPWAGEFGYEIRYGLSRIAILAASDVRVLTTRPSIYPDNMGLYNDSYFAQERALFSKYRVVRSAAAAVPTQGNPLQFRTEWEQLFHSFGYHHHDIGDSVGWHPFYIHNYHMSILSAQDSFTFPPYNPLHKQLALETRSIPMHIGVQFRRRAERPDGRDSPIQEVYEYCHRLSERMNLPLICYGNDVPHEELPEMLWAYSFTKEGPDHISREMTALKKCSLFVTPDSGWSDFLAWLRIPLIMQSDRYNSMALYKRQGREGILMKCNNSQLMTFLKKLNHAESGYRKAT